MGVRQKGLGVAWGITSTGYTYTASATVLSASGLDQDFGREASMEEMPNPITGSTAGVVIYNPKATVKLRLYPNASSLSGAATAATAMPAIGDKFVFTDADTNLSGTPWIVTKVNRQRKFNQRAEFDIELVQYDSDLSADIS